MIIDNIENLKRYAVPKAEAILKFIAGHDCANLPDGTIEIEGRELFVKIMSYEPKPAAENRFETHRIYADLQYLLSGAEIMQTAPLDKLMILSEYNSTDDYQFFKAMSAISDLVVQAGDFAFFIPTKLIGRPVLIKVIKARSKN